MIKLFYPLAFLTGFTYSLYHCVGMCGGFVAAYSATCATGRNKTRPVADWPLHLLFNLGRVTSYTIIGAMFGLAGSLGGYYGHLSGPRIQGITAVAGGVLMILFGISLVGVIRLPAGTLIGGSISRKAFAGLLRSRSPWRTYPMGLLVGTVPCGLVYSMSSGAVASGGSLPGALFMASFGLGTVPAMFCFGFVSTALGGRLRKGMLGIAVALTLIMGIQAIRRGLGVL